MAHKQLTIEYDTDQEFFEDGDESLLGYLANEFDNAGIIARLEEGDAVRVECEAAPRWGPDEIINASRALLAYFGNDAPERLRVYTLALERALP